MFSLFKGIFFSPINEILFKAMIVGTLHALFLFVDLFFRIRNWKQNEK